MKHKATLLLEIIVNFVLVAFAGATAVAVFRPSGSLEIGGIAIVLVIIVWYGAFETGFVSWLVTRRIVRFLASRKTPPALFVRDMARENQEPWNEHFDNTRENPTVR